VDWIEERHHQQREAEKAKAARSAADASDRKRLIQQSDFLWNSLVEEISSKVDSHNRLKSQSPRQQLTKLTADCFVRIIGSVIEPVEGMWFSAPKQVSLEVRFDRAKCVIYFGVPERSQSDSMYFQTSLDGEITFYHEHTAIPQEEAAKIILCSLLDVVDPAA